MKTTRTYFGEKGEANGRCYDPVMSSFLSVDRYVQDPSNSQNFNRYSYCLNNPLKYTDPSGWQMNKPYTPYAPAWGDGMIRPVEPRDHQEGSPIMLDYYLRNGSVSYGGGSSGFAGTYGSSVVNNPYYITNNFYINRELVLRGPSIREACNAWWKDPSRETRQALVDAGISELNVGVLEKDGLRHGSATIEVGGEEYSLPLPTLEVGGDDFYIGVTAPSINLASGAGSGLSGLQKANNRTYETIGTDPGVLRGIGDGIRAVILTGIDEAKLLYSNKGFKIAVKGACHISIAVDLYSLSRAGVNYYNNPTSENAARFKIALLGTAANGFDFLVPGLGTIASMAVFSIDAAGGFDNYYYRQERP